MGSQHLCCYASRQNLIFKNVILMSPDSVVI
nr:MAG TPA: hypothetical protein [Caudoviricetes sp.]DAY46432.1 MAG TPA: hypothetical protein [Caudoviricetes sp.]